MCFAPPVYNDALLSVESHLRAHNKTLEDFPGMPIPDRSATVGLPSRLMQAELAFEAPALANDVQTFVKTGKNIHTHIKCALRCIELTLHTVPFRQARWCT